MLLRFAYLAVTHAFAVLRLLPMTDREKDVEILALRHQLTVCTGNSVINARDYDPRTGHSSPHFSCRYAARRCAGCVCWSARTPSCGGIAI